MVIVVDILVGGLLFINNLFFKLFLKYGFFNFWSLLFREEC